MPAPVPFPSNISAEDMRVRYMCFMLLFHSSWSCLHAPQRMAPMWPLFAKGHAAKSKKMQ